ncbi:MAG: hypothetical protein K0B07_03520 [DPANN group archaeon]|nr:hypothetical protein [DPANN group archaeon]
MKHNNNYVGLSSKGIMTKTRPVNYCRPTKYSSEPKDKVDTLFTSGKQIDNKDRYNRIMERKKNIKPGEIEIPLNAWNKNEQKSKGFVKPQPIKQSGKYGHLFISDSSASASKLAKLKMRAMEVYDDQYTKEDMPKEDEKPSIFSMFGGDDENEDDKRQAYQPLPQSNGFRQEIQQENSFRNTYRQPMTEESSMSEPRSFIEPVNNNFNNIHEPMQDTFSPLPQKNNYDEEAKEEAFNRMLRFEPKKDVPPKKKDNNEWTPIF